jgi:hypothetical protein
MLMRRPSTVIAHESSAPRMSVRPGGSASIAASQPAVVS